MSSIQTATCIIRVAVLVTTMLATNRAFALPIFVDCDAGQSVSGNPVDMFCDSHSVITGGANITNASSVQCTNLLAGDSEAIP